MGFWLLLFETFLKELDPKLLLFWIPEPEELLFDRFCEELFTVGCCWLVMRLFDAGDMLLLPTNYLLFELGFSCELLLKETSSRLLFLFYNLLILFWFY
jgi:hypothetical protein